MKVGSSLLVDQTRGEVKRRWLEALCDDIAALHKDGRDVLVVSSGSIALGRTVLKLSRGPLKLEDSQAAAAVGQIALARTWAKALSDRGMVAGQILVTLNDTEERRRYLNARATIGRLVDLRAIPVINENDTVATTEIRYGDNDRLAARVATMASADVLVLLSDIDGLYTAPPHEDPDAQLIPVVPRISAEIEAMAGGAASEFSRGGMRTKIEAAKIAVGGGAHMVIADGRVDHPIARIADGGRCTWFLTLLEPGHRAQEMDRGLARAARHGPCGRRRRRGARAGRQPAAGGRYPRRGRVRPRRLRPDPRDLGRRTGPRTDRLRRRRGGAAHRPQFPRHRSRARRAGPGGNDPSRRHGAGRRLTYPTAPEPVIPVLSITDPANMSKRIDP